MHSRINTYQRPKQRDHIHKTRELNASPTTAVIPERHVAFSGNLTSKYSDDDGENKETKALCSRTHSSKHRRPFRKKGVEEHADESNEYKQQNDPPEHDIFTISMRLKADQARRADDEASSRSLPSQKAKPA